MRTGKHKKWALLIVVLLLILLLPLPMTRNDGGSIDFCAVLYRCTVWHKINPAYQDGPSTEPKFLTGVSFPFSFHPGIAGAYTGSVNRLIIGRFPSHLCSKKADDKN